MICCLTQAAHSMPESQEGIGVAREDESGICTHSEEETIVALHDI